MPVTQRGPRFEASFGEVGLTEPTRLYLPLNAGRGDPADVSRGRAAVLVRGTGWAPGRFGPALALPHAGAGLAAEGEGPPLVESGAATVELWLWIDAWPAARGSVLGSPELFELELDAEGYLLLSPASPAMEPLRSDEPLPLGAWTPVAVVLGGLPVYTYRLVVDESAKRRETDAEPPAGDGRLLHVGSWGGRPGFAGRVDDLRATARAASTAELFERLAPPAPGEHVLRLRTGEGERVERRWVGALDAPVLGAGSGDAPWRSGELRHVAVAEGGLRWAPAHWTRDARGDPPPPRTAHPTVFLGDHRVFVFGGEARDTHLNPQVNLADTWIYHTERRRWLRLDPPEQPPPRCHTPAAYSPDHDLVFLAGGFVGGANHPKRKVYGDTWVYRVSENRWEERDSHGVPVPRLSDRPAVYHPGEKRFFVFLRNVVLAYDPAGDDWEWIASPTDVDTEGRPVPYETGGSAMASVDPETGAVFLFGGVSRQSGEAPVFLDETAWYDVRENRFVVERHETAPSPRVRSGFAYDSRRRMFVLFGGVRDEESERYGDLWVYPIDARRWFPLDACNPPGPRGGYYGMAYDPELDEHVLPFGREGPRRFLDEVWRLRIDFTADGVARYVFAPPAWAGAERCYAVWRAPEGRELRFRFRSSPDGAVWGAWAPEPPALGGVAGARLQVEVTFPPASDGTHSELLELGFAAGPEPAPPSEESGVRRRRWGLSGG